MIDKYPMAMVNVVSVAIRLPAHHTLIQHKIFCVTVTCKRGIQETQSSSVDAPIPKQNSQVLPIRSSLYISVISDNNAYRQN